MFASLFFFFKQKTAYDMRISDWSSDVCSSDLADTRLLMSFQGQHYFYTGGAHPMVHYLALVYDKPKGTLMRPAGIFADPAAAFAYLTPFYCERLDQLRLEKRGDRKSTRLNFSH